MDTFEFIFSTATDGKIKAWLYHNMGSRVDYDAPGHSSTTMSYSADGTRLFSCGTNKEGESFLVEWNESEGAVKRTYHGLGKRSAAAVKAPTIGAFPSTNAAVVISLADRTPPVAAMVGLNNDSRSLADVNPELLMKLWKNLGYGS
ncbi:WUS-interacting protein [Trifolium repens]|nr:WUS-interacting protein [Trifolium repens]